MASVTKQKENYFQYLIEHSLNPVTVIDEEGIIRFQSKSAEKLWGCPVANLIGKNYLNFIHPRDIPGFLEMFARTKSSRSNDRIIEINFRAQQKAWRSLELTMLNCLEHPPIAGIVISARDITERKRLEREILKIGEEERFTMAQMLHDGITQELAGIEFMVRSLEKKGPRLGVPLRNEIHKISDHIGKAVKSTRELARGLYPIGLKADNLFPAVRTLLEEMKNNHGIEYELNLEESSFRGDDETATHLYHIAQECVRNAIRHGRARRILLEILTLDHEVYLVVRDNGRGFDHGHNWNQGIGTKIMQRRVKTLKGFLEFEENASGGTTVTCILPLDSHSLNREVTYENEIHARSASNVIKTENIYCR